MEFNEQQQVRLNKVDKLRQAGIDPYPPRFLERNHNIASVLEHFDELKKDDHSDPPLEGKEVTVAGRIMLMRDKKVIFADLVEDGHKIQIYIKDSHLDSGAEGLQFFKETVDLGDIIGVRGKPFVTHKGERTIEVSHWWMLTKSLNPLPDKYHGLTDVELRYRQRYVDLIANPGVRDTFIKRSKIISAMRRFLDNRGFLEVETPVLQPLYGGASARPFTTHHNTLDQTFYLRIADELYLKRLIVGGFSKVYEISKDFRNEGMDITHNPEFTMMECYQAFADYHDIMELNEQMFAFIAQEVLGTTKINTRGYEVELQPPWQRITMRDALIKYADLDYQAFPEQAALYEELRKRDVEVAPDTVWPKLVDEAYSKLVRPKLIQPTFLYDYPERLSPLAKRKPGAKDTVERFQAIIAGIEATNAFSELNDPIDQATRFADQAKNRAAGDDEAMQTDDDFINALMYGMPPTGGIGIGIDRLTMLLLDQSSIRDIILFPQMRTIEQE